MQKKLWLLIFLATISRLLISQLTELGNAEVYYWTYALHLQYNYYDHPPMVGWLIRLTTFNLHLHSELFVRLGAVCCAAISTLLIYRIGYFLQDAKTGFTAALLYTGSPYASLLVGAYIIPDSPQLVFWLGSIMVLLKIDSQPPEERCYKYWIGFGVLSALCVLCKLHGVFIWLGLLCYTFKLKRTWFSNKGFYLAFAITLLITSPVLIWNLQNQFVSFSNYGHRINPIAAGWHLLNFLKAIGAIIFIHNPFSIWLIYGAIRCLYKNKNLLEQKGIQLLLYCSLPLIGFMVILAMFREVLPHWPGPAISTLLLLPAIVMNSDVHTRMIKKWPLSATFIFTILFAVLTITITEWYPGPLTQQVDGLDIGKGDPTLDQYGWSNAGKQYDSLFRKDVDQHQMPATSPLLIYQWFPGAHIEYYWATSTGQQTIGIGQYEKLGNYYWSNQYKHPLHVGDSAYLVIPSNLFDYKEFDSLVGRFRSYQLAQTIPVTRAGLLCKQYYVFRMYGYHVPAEQ